jgi:hypothetical protein
MNDDKITENLAGCVAGLLLTPFLIALRGWVIATLWRWLVVPTFGLRVLSVWQAIGLSVIVGVLTMKTPDNDDDSALETVIKILAYSAVSYAVVLVLGWIVAHQIGG